MSIFQKSWLQRWCPSAVSIRWIAISIFMISGVLNYVDRQILATAAVSWHIHPEFPFNYTDYGILIQRFSIAYALCAPLMGLLLDWMGLNAGISICVFLWSITSILTGRSHSFTQLIWCRTTLGAVEAAGVPAMGKASGIYLLAKERALGTALSNVGLSVGGAIAPLLAAYVGWRSAFYLAGILGIIWIPTWAFTSRLTSHSKVSTEVQPHISHWEMLSDKALWAMVAANFLSMTFYTLWTNWIPAYLEHVFHLSTKETANYSWAVPIAGYLGALSGAWLSWHFIARGATPVGARKRVCLLAATCVALFSIGIPFLGTPFLATVGMALSFFSITAWSTNLYTLPVDIYGAHRAGFGVSALIFAYGLMQAITSRAIGQVIEQHGFTPLILTFAILPLVGYVLLKVFVHDSRTLQVTSTTVNI